MIRIVEFDTAIGTSNLGDEIILECLREEMKDILSQGFTMRLGTHVANYPRKYMLQQRFKMQFVNHADYKFIMGTNLLTSHAKKTWAQFFINGAYGWPYENAIMAGVGTTFESRKITKYTKKLYGRLLNKNFKHSVRDEEAKELLEQAGIKAINTGCPTLWNLTPEHCAKIPTKKADRVVFSLSGYTNQKKPRADIKLIRILQENYKELIFWCQTSEDEAYLESFEGMESIRRIYTLKEYASLLDEGNIDYVGTRLHGGVFAMRHYVRSIVIAIDHRARGFYECNNLPICERSALETRLPTMINSEFETDIHIDEAAIHEWKDQFKELVPQEFEASNSHFLMSKLAVTKERIRKGVLRRIKKVKRKIPGAGKKVKRLFRKVRNRISPPAAPNVGDIEINNEQIMFFTFQGKYTCNAKYICDEILRRRLPWKVVWVTTKPVDKVKKSFPEQAVLVKFRSKAYYRELAASHILIDNAFNYVKVDFEKKPGQIYVETMHGSLGIKRIGRDDVSDPKRNARGDKCGENTDYCLSNSTFEDEVFRTSFWPESQILDLGHARNDIFFASEDEVSRIRKKVFNYFVLPYDVKLALYAPTFRDPEDNEGYEFLEPQILKEALEERFGGRWIVLERAHTRDAGEKCTITSVGEDVIDATGYPDIQELMLAIDFGITDYSSWIYDYVLTRKPGLIYAPDAERYANGQGFYYPLTETPFPIAASNDDLTACIKAFDTEKYASEVERFLRDRGCIDDGKASARIVDWLNDQIEKGTEEQNKLRIGLLYLKCDNLGDKIIYDSVRYMAKDILKKKGISDYEFVPIDIDGYAQRRKITAARKHSSLKEKCHDLGTKVRNKWYGLSFTHPTPEKLRESWRSDSLYQWYFKEERPKISRVDVLIFCGGGILKYKAQKLYFFVDDITEIADKYKIPVFMNSVGVEDFDENDPRCLMLLNAIKRECVKSISTRDDLDLLREKYTKDTQIETERVSDPAFWSPEAYNIHRKEDNKGLIGLNVARPSIFEYIYKNSHIDLTDAYNELMHQLIAEGYRLEIFTNGLGLDKVFAKRLLEKYPEWQDHEKVSFFYPSVAEELVDRIAGYERILAVRLHASIVATALGVPHVDLVWNEKQIGFGRIIGKSEFFLMKEDFNAETIRAGLLKATPYEECESYRATVYQGLEKILTYADDNYRKNGHPKAIYVKPAKKNSFKTRLSQMKTGVSDAIIFKTTKVDRKNIAIMTNSYRYTCNPKYIYEEINRRKPDWNVTWITDGPETDKAFYPKGVKTVHTGTRAGAKAAASAYIWLDNGIAFSRNYSRKNDQLHIQTMHGSLGIKKLDNAVLSRQKSHSGRLASRRESERTNYVITNSLFEENVFKTIFWKNVPMVRLGHARTDILFGYDEKTVEVIRRRLRSKYGIDPNKKIFMYGPTYRNDQSLSQLDLNYGEIITTLREKFGEEYVFLLRLHNRTVNNLNLSTAIPGTVFDVSDYPDMQELMAVTDMAVTDYSSWIFDYVVTGKRGLIYATDVENYSDSTGLYYPLEETPFPVCHNNVELIEAIRAFDDDNYAVKVREFLEEKEAVDDGHSAERIVDWFEQLIGSPASMP